MEELGDVDEREEQGVIHLFVLGRPTLSFFLPPLSCLLIIHWGLRSATYIINLKERDGKLTRKFGKHQ